MLFEITIEYRSDYYFLKFPVENQSAEDKFRVLAKVPVRLNQRSGQAERKIMKMLHVLMVAVCLGLVGTGLSVSAGQTATSVAPKLSWGLDDIVKLSKAGVEESVILSYIQNSSVGYNPTPQDIIQLRELGVSSQITTALMQHGKEVRQTATVEAQKQSQAAATAAATQPAPVYTAPATYVAPASTVTYIGYPRYAYSYNGYCGPTYSNSYPYYPRYYGYYGGYYPRVSVGVRLGGGHFGGFHGGFRHCR